ncbi:MAG: hypothetical protein ACR2QK_12880 [Acidimicrobiales bacterium]
MPVPVPVSRRGRADRASAGVGLALGAVCLVVMMMFGVGALRLTTINGQVSAASRAGARAAAAGYGHDSGLRLADAVVADSLLAGRSTCRSVRVEVAGSWQPGGWVEATVTCTVSLADVGPAGFAARRTVSHTAGESIDSFRGGG